MTAERKIGAESEQPLQPTITYAALDRGIEFVFLSSETAKVGALKAMRAIHLDEGISSDIQGVDLSRGRGSVDWDYYGFYALKTHLRFEQIEDGRWLLDVDKVYSEGSSLRVEVERTVGEPSLVSGASISLEFPTPDQGGRYLETIGMNLTPELLGRLAQDRAYWSLSILLRDLSAGYDHRSQRDVVDRPEDMGQVVLDFVNGADRDVQGTILTTVDQRMSETHMDDWSTIRYRYPGGSLEAALAREDFDPVRAIQEIFGAMDKAAKPGLLGRSKLHFGVYSSFYREVLEKSYNALPNDERVKLFEALYARCKARVEEKGTPMPAELRFDDENRSRGFSERSLDVNAEAPIQSEYFVARTSTNVAGTFNLEERVFRPDNHPTGFSLRVYPTPAYRYSNDGNVQALINVAASRLALQEPDYLTARTRSAKADNSHNWAIDKLGTALARTDDPNLQSMGLTLLEKRTQSGAKNPKLN